MNKPHHGFLPSFSGDIDDSFAGTLTASTDNSIYQLFPKAVLHPKTEADIHLAIHYAMAHRLSLTPRGGGTGTNGQSLNTGLILDTSTHMRQVHQVLPNERIAIVDPGVVLDQLNTVTQSYGLFFAPHVATSSRATIGGMVSTDASGKGSRIYGRTSQHIPALRGMLPDGRVFVIGEAPDPAFQDTEAKALGRTICSALSELTHPHKAEIISGLPRLSRFFTGYNLRGLCKDTPDMIPLICGSEGTLCVLTRIAVMLHPIPEHTHLVILPYPSMNAAMTDVQRLLEYAPTAIETLDEHTLTLARQDSAYETVASFFDRATTVHLVSFSGTPELVRVATQRLAQDSTNLGLEPRHVSDTQQQQNCWTLRKRAVGLLLRLPGKAKPIAFIEDTVVPPEHLAAYIQDLRHLLEKYGVFYAMYGHADVGCVHVRPALDLQSERDKAKYIALSDEVLNLVSHYGGLLWGEHGKGIRGHYTETVLSPQLYQLMRGIKTYFDPDNRLNPGKLYAPLTAPSYTLYHHDTPLRADRDKEISQPIQDLHQAVMACNGNGACFSIAKQDKMCPSFKVTLNRIDSPKGRAGLLKEWLHVIDPKAFHANTHHAQAIYTATKDSLDRCLSCKGCTMTCPAQVDIPETRSLFLEDYHKHYRRPLRDYVFATLEYILPIGAAMPRLTQFLLKNMLFQQALKRLRLADIPKPPVKPSFPPKPQKPTVLLVPDLFSTYLHPNITTHTLACLERLGEHPWLLPFHPHGKAQHVLGMRKWSSKIAKAHLRHLNRMAMAHPGIPIVVMDPSIATMYTQDYRALGFKDIAHVVSLGTYLQRLFTSLPKDKAVPTSEGYTLFSHCMESLSEAQAWQSVLERLGYPTTVQQLSCCGMAGMFGHQTEQKTLSKAIFENTWAPALSHRKGSALITGYSCRSQILRFLEQETDHPISVVWKTVSNTTPLVTQNR